MNKNIIAFGRSGYLFNSIKYLSGKGYQIKAIITDESYKEYNVLADDFLALSQEIGSAFFLSKTLDKKEILDIISDNNIQVAISANWQYKVPGRILDLFTIGILNFHLGNLPDYKGNATVNWTIINNEKHIFGNIHKMDPLLDAGDVISRKKILINADTYIQDIINEAEKDAPVLFENALEIVFSDPLFYEVKGSVEGLRCYPRLPEDSQINWHLDNVDVFNLIRASSSPYPGAYSFYNGQKIIIWKAKLPETISKCLSIPGHIINIDKYNKVITVSCGKGVLEIMEIEMNGKRLAPTDIFNSIRERFKFIENA